MDGWHNVHHLYDDPRQEIALSGEIVIKGFGYDVIQETLISFGNVEGVNRETGQQWPEMDLPYKGTKTRTRDV